MPKKVISKLTDENTSITVEVTRTSIKRESLQFPLFFIEFLYENESYS